jgi:hypothetical protein
VALIRTDVSEDRIASIFRVHECEHVTEPWKPQILHNILLSVFLWAKGLNARIFINKCFLFMVGSVCHVKWFATGLINSLKDVQKSQMMPDHVWKWLRQQSKDFCAVGFDTLLKQWDKCINVGGGYFEK